MVAVGASLRRVAVAPAVLGSIVDVFERNFREMGELGASLSIWWNGEEILGEADGWCDKAKSRPWTTQTLVPVYSVSKGPSAATLLMALESRGLSPETPVREVWPAFPVAEATFAQLLSHQAGLAALDRRTSVWEHDEVVAAIEAQEPAWPLGQGHGYHPRTFGALLEEPVRRLTGKALGQYFRQVLGDPLGLEFWIGLPAHCHPRVATLYPGKADKSDLQHGFYQEFHREGSLVRRAFSSPRGIHSVQDMNDPKAWSAGFPALGGIGTASALAKFYQAAIGAIPSPLSPAVRAAMATTRVQGEDRILMRETAFTCGFQKDPVGADGVKLRRLYGSSPEAFGHPGAGGSHAFGDPSTGISFAYVMNQMELGVFPGRKSRDLIEALFDEG